ncbi:MAG TPA: bifunctional 4-hydroxy-2-oxoglutarate aldolase/2-dehydro-3-deoxy-phosphogluconate aldolase [Candidatus Acidoferrum sp.]|nr:bifunctional 4-hydroxy-2-oxoglutarate aldolase/2-dehydro-3-deoxy-phosphogluconate aldolase [Candidatus Acidoferrum sp.]
MNKEEVRQRIAAIGIVPAVRLRNAEDARFATQAVCHGGISIVEITMTVPGAVELIAEVAKNDPELVVGAGTVFDTETASKCLDAGAKFLTSPGLDLQLVEFASKREVAVLAGALTPTEVTLAWKAGADFVKVFPCSLMGGEQYIRALKAPFRHVPLIAAGGVNQMTAAGYILAGASAIGVGGELVPEEAIHLRQEERIHELARRFVGFVTAARAQMSSVKAPRKTR